MADLPNPKSRKELYEYNAVKGITTGMPEPKSREELYLKTLAENGGGGGGTTNYNQLTNKPSINNVVLSGNKTTEDLIPIGDGLDFDANGKLITTGGGSGAVDSVNGKTGVVVLDAEDVGALPDDTDIPDSTSDLTNDSGFITGTVNNLLNYYLKSETYTQAEVNALISAIVTLDIQAVAILPTENISRTTIYLVPSADPQTQNIKDEYINLDGTTSGWELIGSTEIDLSGYVTTTALNTALANYVLSADLSNVATSGDFDDLTNRPLESDTIDISELDLQMPAKPTEYPVLFDESGGEYQVGLYKRASDGKVKPIYRKDFTGNMPSPKVTATITIGTNIEKIVKYDNIVMGPEWGFKMPKIALDVTNDSAVVNTSASNDFVPYLSNGTATLKIFTGAVNRTSFVYNISAWFTKSTDEWKEV